jgi:hypothetical protein
VEHRVADPRILRLIQKWLKAGVMEDGKWSETVTGTPQGAVISPLLANIYLHYVFDLWADVWRKKRAQGEVVLIRYADDTIVGFQSEADADRFLEDLGKRLEKFGLEPHPEKTRRIEFGRFAERNREQRGEGKPETFDFLGFTHISGKNRLGRFAVRRTTIRKRMQAKLREIKQQLRQRMHDPVAQPATGSGRLYKATSTTMRYQETSRAWACFAIACWLSGGVRYVAAARDVRYRGRGFSLLLADGFRHRAYSIPIPMHASPLHICDKNRMR